jgi:hypothetical protein
VEEDEPAAAGVAVLPVQRLDAAARRVEDLRIARQRFGGSVAQVGQQREVQIRIVIAERLDLEVFDQLAGPLDAVQDRRHDDHRPGIVRDGQEVEPRQRLGGITLLMIRWTICIVSSLAGDRGEQRQPDQHGAMRAVPGGKKGARARRARWFRGQWCPR